METVDVLSAQAPTVWETFLDYLQRTVLVDEGRNVSAVMLPIGFLRKASPFSRRVQLPYLPALEAISTCDKSTHDSQV